MRRLSEGQLVAIVAGTLTVIALILTIVAVKYNQRFETWCHNQGGHVVTNTEVGTAVVPGSQPGVGVSTTTTRYCLSEDGRILGIA